MISVPVGPGELPGAVAATVIRSIVDLTAAEVVSLDLSGNGGSATLRLRPDDSAAHA